MQGVGRGNDRVVVGHPLAMRMRASMTEFVSEGVATTRACRADRLQHEGGAAHGST